MKKRLKEIKTRLSEIRQLLRNDSENALTDDEIAELEVEIERLTEERAELVEKIERRSRIAEMLVNTEDDLSNNNAGIKDDNPNIYDITTLHRGSEIKGNRQDIYDTIEYRTAFMNYVCRNAPIPVKYREDQTTTTSETGAIIPTTLLNQIITKLETYGTLYAKFTKTNIQGGVEIPIADFKPTANWISETSTSDDQKLTANDKIAFNYYGLECRIAQSILSNVVSLEMFNKLFIPLATEAMVRAIEKAFINGDGQGKPLGITKDKRIIEELKDTNIIDMNEQEMTSWAAWHKKVKSKMKKSYRTGEFILNQATFDSDIDGMEDKNGQPVGRTNYGINGEETYRFMGKTVETVESDIFPSYDEAKEGEIFGAFIKLSDYIINTNMQMQVIKWTDHNDNKVKNKAIMILDGKAGDVNGILLLRKAKTTTPTTPVQQEESIPTV